MWAHSSFGGLGCRGALPWRKGLTTGVSLVVEVWDVSWAKVGGGADTQLEELAEVVVQAGNGRQD